MRPQRSRIPERPKGIPRPVRIGARLVRVSGSLSAILLGAAAAGQVGLLGTGPFRWNEILSVLVGPYFVVGLPAWFAVGMAWVLFRRARVVAAAAERGARSTPYDVTGFGLLVLSILGLLAWYVAAFWSGRLATLVLATTAVPIAALGVLLATSSRRHFVADAE